MIKSKLIATVITIGMSLLTTPALAQFNDNQVNAFVNALKQAAPPQQPNDGMYSDWQVLPGIIPSWSKQCLGKEMTPAQFDSNSADARKVVTCIMKRELNTQYQAVKGNEIMAVRRTACWWMTGKAEACSSGATATYADKVVSNYQKQPKS